MATQLGGPGRQTTPRRWQARCPASLSSRRPCASDGARAGAASRMGTARPLHTNARPAETRTAGRWTWTAPPLLRLALPPPPPPALGGGAGAVRARGGVLQRSWSATLLPRTEMRAWRLPRPAQRGRPCLRVDWVGAREAGSRGARGFCSTPGVEGGWGCDGCICVLVSWCIASRNLDPAAPTFLLLVCLSSQQHSFHSFRSGRRWRCTRRISGFLVPDGLTLISHIPPTL